MSVFTRTGSVMFLFCILLGCKSTLTEQNSQIEEKSFLKNIPALQEINITEALSGILPKIFKKVEVSDTKSSGQDVLEKVVVPVVEFKEFNRKNTYTNLRLSIEANPRVLSAIWKVKSYEAEIAALRSIQALKSDVQAIGGLETENRDTDAGAAIVLSAQKLIYDANSSDLSIESKKFELNSGETAAFVAADLVALQSYRAWIDLVRYREVNNIYSDGFKKAEPLLKQIESVSNSGLTDKKALLSARRNVMELMDRRLGAQSMEKIAEEIFLDSFPGADLATVLEAPQVDINAAGVFTQFDKETAPSLQEKRFLNKALLSNIASLEASERPRVAFNTTVNAPAENTLDDGTATAGLRLTYSFNDGGALKARIDQTRAQLEILQSETKALEKSLKIEYQKQIINYETSQERLLSLKTLIEVSEEILEMARQQVFSGRSTIKDVLDAEVSLSTLKIDRVNVQADVLLTLLTTQAYKDGLTTILDWSY